MNTQVETASLWSEVELPMYGPLTRDIDVDVAVVGAGLTGVTTAYLLTKAGLRVALIDRARAAQGDTRHTTAHLTYVTDRRLSQLSKQFGEDGARAFWEAGAAAIDQIWKLTQATRVPCEFRWVPGFLSLPVGTDDASENDLAEDARLAMKFGFETFHIESSPFTHRPAIQFAHQAKLHPLRYLSGLLQAFRDGGGHVFELTALEGVEAEPLALKANGHRIRCQRWVLATHNPVMGDRSALAATLFQTKLALYTSYVMGAKLPKGTLPEALYWDTKDPYSYLRIDDHPSGQYAIFGGRDVKTGQEGDTNAVFADLEKELRDALPVAQPERRWLGQVIETADGVPYVGPSSDTQFIATGYAGNGFTLGTVAAMAACDWVLGRNNPWADLFRIDRKAFHGGVWRYLKENADYPYYLLRDRLRDAEDLRVEDLAPGSGALVMWRGEKVAAYRGVDGALALCSPVCTHLKCLVRWNAAGHTWDCPYHGSRFRPDGTVLSGPAEKALERVARTPAN